jgi:hypothetical protein
VTLDHARHRRLAHRTGGLATRARVLSIECLQLGTLFRIQQRSEIVVVHDFTSKAIA